jgi:hypothetical protein
MRLTQRVRQQIKHLILWRSTFYVADFLRQRPMLSFKELQRLYLLFCALCNTVCGMLPQQELVLRTNALSFPMAKARGLPRVLLIRRFNFYPEPYALEPGEAEVVKEPRTLVHRVRRWTPAIPDDAMPYCSKCTRYFVTYASGMRHAAAAELLPWRATLFHSRPERRDTQREF